MDITNKKTFDKDIIIDALKITFFNLESDDTLSTEEKVKTIIYTTSIICAAITIQPIPFIDAILLTPIQLLMIVNLTTVMQKEIAIKENGNYIKNAYEVEGKEILLTIASATGAGLVAQQGLVGLYKTFMPFVGAVTAIPMAFATTFAIGTVAKTVIEKRLKNEEVDKEMIKNEFNELLHFKEAEMKEKDDLIGFLNEEINKLGSENSHYKVEISRLEEELDEVHEKIEQASIMRNDLVTIIDDNVEISETIFVEIDNATESIYLSIYDISEYDLLSKLEKKSKEGLEIKILTDYHKTMGNFLENGFTNEHGSSQTTYSKKTLQRLKNCFKHKNVTVRMFGKDTKGIHHRKDIILDGKVLISGSANFTKRAFTKNMETIFLVKDQHLVQQKINCFERLFYSDKVSFLEKSLLRD